MKLYAHELHTPTTLTRSTTHQIAAVTTAGEAVGAQALVSSFFFFGSTNVFLFYLDYMHMNYTTSTHPMTHQMPASVTTTHARPSQPDEMAVVAASGEGGRGP